MTDKRLESIEMLLVVEEEMDWAERKGLRVIRRAGKSQSQA